MDATAAQSASGAPSRFEDVARDTAPPMAKAGGVGHVPPPQQTGVTGARFAPLFTSWNGIANLLAPCLRMFPAEVSRFWHLPRC